MTSSWSSMMVPGSLQRLWQKAVAGGPGRRSRLHDAQGNRIDARGLVYLPVSLASTAARLAAGYYLPLPWIGFRATRRLARLLHREASVLEFGSGMSTAWFAQRCRRVVSIESNEEWYRNVSEKLAQRGLRNVDYRYDPDPDAYCRPELGAETFDLVVIDGAVRSRCVAAALERARPGSFIYLDNSDVEQEAQQALSIAAREGGLSVEYFVDFVPGYTAVTQGMLVRIGER